MVSDDPNTQAKATSEEFEMKQKQEQIARLLFMLIGVGYLFPFSALTQPVDYWNLLFPDFDIEFPITAYYMWVNLLLLAVFVFLGDTKPNYSLRMYTGFCGQFLALVIVPTSYFWHLSESGNKFVVIGSTAFAAGVTALIDSCVISLSATYPVSCQEGLQVGIGLSTLIGSVYRVFTKAAFPTDKIVESSLLYFYSGAATIMCCVVAFYKLIHLPKFEHDGINSSDSGHGSDATPLVGHTQDESGKTGNSEGYGALEIDDTKAAAMPARSRGQVFGSVLFQESIVFVVFTSTLALWPPLVAEIKSVNFPHLNETEWWPLIMLFIFASLDVIGRFCVSYRGWLTADNIWVVVALRVVVLTPAIISCVTGVFFTNDAWAVLFVGALGFSNGYLGSMSIIFVNESVPIEDKTLAGTLTGFTLNAGLVCGATLAIWLKDLITN